MIQDHWPAKLITVCAVCSFVYAVTTMTLEKVCWNYADKVTGGVLKAQDKLLNHKMKNFGQYIYHLEILLGKNGKPITESTWEEARIEYARKLEMELKMAKALHGVIQSYTEAME